MLSLANNAFICSGFVSIACREIKKNSTPESVHEYVSVFSTVTVKLQLAEVHLAAWRGHHSAQTSAQTRHLTVWFVGVKTF